MCCEVSLIYYANSKYTKEEDDRHHFCNDLKIKQPLLVAVFCNMMHTFSPHANSIDSFHCNIVEMSRKNDQ